MRHYTYLLVCLVLLVPALTVIVARNRKFLRKHTALILGSGIFGLVFAVCESPAAQLKMWTYNPNFVLPYNLFEVQIETYILTFLFFCFICTITLLMLPTAKRR